MSVRWLNVEKPGVILRRVSTHIEEGTQIIYGVPYCPAHIARLEAAGHFPKRVKLGACRVAWVAEEVEAWIEERIGNR